MGPPPFKRSANGAWTTGGPPKGNSQRGGCPTNLAPFVGAGGSGEEKHTEVAATQDTNYGSFDESIFQEKHADVSATQETDYGDFDESVFLPLMERF
jgi:hypothetical protein